MRRLARWATVTGTLVALATFGAACGSSDQGSTTASQETSVDTVPQGVKGGKVTVLAAGDVDFIDPGQTYYAFGYMVDYAVMRPLYSFAPGTLETAQNDLAAGPPVLSDGGRTVTVTLRPDVRYAPPVDRAVTAQDVKYAIERAFSANVPNGYAFNYFSVIEGTPKEPTDGVKPISGLQTPDDQTLVFRLKTKESGTLVAALVMPITMPVPAEYAKPFDAKSPSTYDQHVAFSGPYMIPNDPKTGKLTGREPGKSIELVRSPNWDAATDYRPAYLDGITIQEGNTDAAVSSRRILQGSGLMQGDNAPPAPTIKQAVQRYPDQLKFVPALGPRYVSLNTSIPPFDDLNVRKAVNAVFDRTAMRLTRGGAIIGDIAWGYLPPGFPGFAASGGLKPPAEFDFLQDPDGDPELAAEYMKKAGYPSGRYTGDAKLLTAAINISPGSQTAAVAQNQFEKLGFKLNFRSLSPETMTTKFCGTPQAKVAICTNVATSADFVDPEALLKPYFYGPAITPSNNANWSELDDPRINAAMDAASALPPGDERVNAWADVNKQIVASAAAVPWIWDKTPLIASKDVQSLGNAYLTSWDLSFTSLKP